MTIATQFARIQTAKGEIKAAIEAKGVTVAPELTLDAYPAKIAEITTGGSGGEWTKPADWIDISTVADNEINLLVTEGSGFAFTCTVAGSGTFSVDWGDGTIDHLCTSGAVQQHIHTTGGTPWTATGGHTWKVRVYNATAAITTWKIARHSYTNRRQYSPLLWAVVGAQGLTDCSNMFYNSTGLGVWCVKMQAASIISFASCTTTANMFYNCFSLVQTELPETWGAITNVSSMFYSCYSLCCFILPATWGNITTVYQMFYACYAINSITLPTSWGLITSLHSFLYSCTSLVYVTLPTSWGSVQTTTYMLYGCTALQFIAMPASWGTINNNSYMFYLCNSLYKLNMPTQQGNNTTVSVMLRDCYSLQTINGFENLGSLTTQVDFFDILRDCENLQTPIVCSSLLSRFGAYGAAGYVLKIPSIRLTNPGSTFTGSTPQINVSYTSLSASALENLFTDLPTLTGKTINIIGCVGTSSLTSTQLDIAINKGWNVVY